MTVGWQRALVCALAILSLALITPDFTIPSGHGGSFGVQFASDGQIIAVRDRGPAARAGIRSGDRVDLGATPLTSRQWIQTGLFGVPQGRTASFVIERDGRARTITLTATAVRALRTFHDDLSNDVLIAAWTAFMLIAAWLCFLRPSRMMWAFFCYALVACSTTVVVAPMYLPFGWYAAFLAFASTQAASALFLMAFALRFPGDTALGWRRRAEAITWALIIATLAFAMYLAEKELFAPDAFILAGNSLLGAIQIASTVAAAATFVITYRQARGADRARIRWVLVGLAIGQTGLLAFEVTANVPAVTIAWPVWAINYDLALQLAIPLTIAYAIARHRIFDVRVVIRRALVYVALTAGIVVALASVEVIVGKVLAQSRLAAVLDIIASIAIGVALSGTHKRLERVVDAVLYRRRRDAERRLRRLAAGLTHASSASSVADTVVRETVDALELTSAAVFRHGDGAYHRVAALGWHDAPLAPLNIDAPAVLQLRAEHTPLRLSDATWVGLPLPSGERRPVLAVPIAVRDVVEAIAFFGGHRSGEDLDAQELSILIDLAHAAGAAFDHISTSALIERMQLLEHEITLLRAAPEAS